MVSVWPCIALGALREEQLWSQGRRRERMGRRTRTGFRAWRLSPSAVGVAGDLRGTGVYGVDGVGGLLFARGVELAVALVPAGS